MDRVLAPVCPDCGSVCKITIDLGSNPTDEQVRAAENRWTCLGGTYRIYGYSGPDPHPDEGCVLRDKTCPGRTDIVADEKLWAEVKRAWRTRTKTTVYVGSAMHEPILHLPLALLPNGGREEHRGTWTVVVTFEPEDER